MIKKSQDIFDRMRFEIDASMQTISHQRTEPEKVLELKSLYNDLQRHMKELDRVINQDEPLYRIVQANFGLYTLETSNDGLGWIQLVTSSRVDCERALKRYKAWRL